MPFRRIQAAPRSTEQERLDAIDREVFDGDRTVAELIADGELIPDDPGIVPMMKIVAVLVRARKSAGIKASEVARRTGADRATISRLENAVNPNPSIETLTKYAEAIGCRLVATAEKVGEPA